MAFPQITATDPKFRFTNAAVSQVASTLTGNITLTMAPGLETPANQTPSLYGPSSPVVFTIFRAGGAISAHSVTLKKADGTTICTWAASTAGWADIQYDPAEGYNTSGTVIRFSGVTVA